MEVDIVDVNSFPMCEHEHKSVKLTDLAVEMPNSFPQFPYPCLCAKYDLVPEELFYVGFHSVSKSLDILAANFFDSGSVAKEVGNENVLNHVHGWCVFLVVSN